LGQILSQSISLSLKNRSLDRQFVKILNRHKPDVINIHNLHSAGWPVRLVKTAIDFAPTVWTLHDCWSFDGSFYPSYCPPPTKHIKNELLYFWKSLKNKSPRFPLSAVTPSKWMQNQASSTSWNDLQVRTIHNPIPKTFFEKRDRESCKKTLGLSLKKTVVLCIAGNLDEERKGGHFLKKILSSDLIYQAQFLLIGNSNKKYEFCDQFINLGFVKDEVTLQIAYHAADILLHPAPIDNLPNTVAESICCGTPALAFKTSGLTEMVIPNKSGWLVKQTNADSMGQELSSIIQTRPLRKLRDTTRQIGSELFDEQKIGSAYNKLFNSFIN
jgi:glycosyltransferase involved in cell wall biosynthesis